MSDHYDHYIFLDDEGRPQRVDVQTGEVTDIAPTKKDLAQYKQVRGSDQRLRWVPLEGCEGTPREFNHVVADAICEAILSGRSLTKILSELKMPYSMYCRWRREVPDFAENVEQARRDRAELLFEKIEEVAETTTQDADAVALGRLKADIYKYAASVTNPKFNQKHQIEGKIGIGRLIVDTGIRREGDLGYSQSEFLGTIEEGQKQIAKEEEKLFIATSTKKLEGVPSGDPEG